MSEEKIRLSVPARAEYARCVRMLAASLAASDDLSLDDVEDIRMAAEEGFVFACSTNPDSCDICFTREDQGAGIAMDFILGKLPDDASETTDEDSSQLALVELLLSAICDEHSIVEYNGTPTLHLLKRASHAG